MIEESTGKVIFHRSTKILVVDDHDLTRQLAEKMLHKAGYTKTSQAMSGNAAWNKIQAASAENDPFQLFIIDWHMPEMDGIELTKLIKKEASLRDVPIMFLTGENSAQGVREAVMVGADAYVLKPFSYSQLVTGLHNLYQKATNK